MTYRPALFVSSTPIPDQIREVTLHEDTWFDKITYDHIEMEGLERVVEQTIAAPTNIWSSSTTQGNYVFVNERYRDSRGYPLRVAVKPVGLDGEVRSAYFSSNTTPGERIWAESSKK